ncbi:MAG: DNA topoisomerase 3 [Chitinophagales bacterium]
MKLCIAEKPSVAKEIAFILNAKSRKDGYFEGNGYAVTWTFGHFCTLKTPDDYRPDWKQWRLESLPMLPEKFDIKLINNPGAKKQFKVIQQLLKQCDSVINCGDAGQEGELIQRWVLKQAKYNGPVQRLWISSLTPEAIRAGFNNLKDAQHFDRLYFAGSARAICDWILGMNATRLYTLKYGGYKQVLSIGRVQTPTLALLVERHKEIENFVPTPFWELQTVYREVTFNCEKGRFLKKEEGEVFLEQVKDKPFVITSFTKKKGREYPPSLYDLTSLQVHCNKRFGYTAEDTLKIAQKLYEKKVITYPRVDTTYLPNDVYPKVPHTLEQMTDYDALIAPILAKQPLRKSGKVFNDSKVTDHHAIIPTGIQKQLMPNEQNVYDAVSRQFIAAFYPDCIVSNTTVLGEVDGVKFKATGKEILEEGWRVVFPKPPQKQSSNTSKKDGKKTEEENLMPTFKKGETGPHEPNLAEKVTQPPKVYSEATLLRAMETAGKKVDDEQLRELMKDNGIGRPSTRANIIETLFKRKYIERHKKQVLPTEVGIQLIDTIQNDLLKSAELTGQWEKQLREIEKGTYSAKVFINNMKAMVENLVKEVKTSNTQVQIQSSNSSARGGKNTNFKGRDTFKEKKPTLAPPKKTQIQDSNSKAKKSKTIAAKGSNAIVGLTCPKCNKGSLLQGKTAYGCNQWKSGCNFRLPFSFKNKAISENQLARLIARGSTVQLKGFEENGAKVNGRIVLDDDFQLVFEAKEGGKSNIKSSSKPILVEESIVRTLPKPKPPTKEVPDEIACPKCGKGQVIKGKMAYGCSRWREGCDFRFAFSEVRHQANGQKLTKGLVWRILNGF